MLGFSQMQLMPISDDPYPGSCGYQSVGYYAATTTFRFGLDPDNHTIPLVTSGMDLMGVICLVVALTVFGVA